MKIMITGDWHITLECPVRRMDNYWEALTGKLLWIAETFQEEKCSAIVQPGDFFDSFRANDYLKSFVIDLFRDIKILTVFGQHDLKYHNVNVANTPLSLLGTVGTVKILNHKPHVLGNTAFFGASWNEPIPKNGEPPNVLVMHRMVIDTEKLWPGQTGFLWAEELNHIKFDLVITGDNHQSFRRDKVINCGSLMRSRIDQKDHRPCVWICDLDTMKTKQLFIPIKPASEVFDTEAASQEKEINEKLDLFVRNLRQTGNRLDLDFRKNLYQAIKDNEIDQEIVDIIHEAMEE